MGSLFDASHGDALAHVWKADHVHVGDLVAYNGKRFGRFTARHLIRVSQVKDGDVLGFREHPQEWERKIEFTIYERQIEAHGVHVFECVEVPVA